ncbi:MAG: hypothetical protein LUF92_16165, partial [Clostridiales bacterium]|nr:hypothetical protein [Clostridiales bacterium]
MLDEKEVNIDALKENVRSYQELERMLLDVKKRISELERINEKEAEIEKYIQKGCNYEYYLARVEVDLTKDAIADAESKKHHAEMKQEELDRKKRVLFSQREEGQETITNLRMELNGDEDYLALRELERRREQLTDSIEQDKREVKHLRKAVKQALADAKKLLQARKQGIDIWQSKEDFQCVRDYVTYLEQLEDLTSGQPEEGRSENNLPADELSLSSVRMCLEDVISYKKETYKKLQESLAEIRMTLRNKQEEMTGLRFRIAQLEKKQLTYPKEVTLVAEQIREQFHRTGRTGEVRVLCELLEITDPAWQKAVEGYLSRQRFYLLVEPEDFDLALNIYDKMRENKEAYGVGVINTGKLEDYDEAPAGSLAEKVTSKSIWARRYVNMVLGRVHCCESYQELKQYPIAITRQCMRYQNHVAIAIRPEIYRTPYIGKEAYLHQLEQCREREQVLEGEIDAVEQQMDYLTFAETALDSSADVDVKFRLSSLAEQRNHEKQLAACQEQIKKLEASQTLILKQIHLQELMDKQKEIQYQISNVDINMGRCRQQVQQMEEQLEEYSIRLFGQETELAELMARLGNDISFYEGEYEKQKADKELWKLKDTIERKRKTNATQRENAEQTMFQLMN